MLAVIASLVLAAAGQQAAPPAATQPPPVQRPAPPPPYNPQADARAQIAAALKAAGEDGIRVLLNFGANDDEPSKAFAAARRNRDLTTFFSDEYRSVNVDVGALDRNLDVAKTYGVTLKAGDLPALAVLDAGGKVLARASAASLRSDTDPAAFDPAKIAAFLRSNQPPPAPDAQPLFDAAMKQASAQEKTLFVWFSAPW